MPIHDRRTTLTRYTIEQEHRHPEATGDFSGLLNAIATAVKMIAKHVNKGLLGGSPDNMRTGQRLAEHQERVSAVSVAAMLHETEWAGHLAGMASSGRNAFFPIPAHYPRGKYLLLFDPLDSSGNLELNISVGSMFSILRSARPLAPPRPQDFLQPGAEQVCAGFALYGPTTMLVFTTGDGVNGFTLDRDIGSFVLTHPQMRLAEDTSEFAINASHERFWDPPVKRYIAECLAGNTGPRGKDFSMRWTASLVAETYRILTRGGVILLPTDSDHGPQAGCLSLMYEANPISFIIEQAGGAASTGRERILDIQPTSLQHRVPLLFGSQHEVERLVRYHNEHDRGLDTEYSSPLFRTRSLFMNP